MPLRRLFLLDRPDHPDVRAATLGGVETPWSVAPPDALGEALHHLRLAGTFYCRSELTAPWGLTVPPLPGHLWLHVVTAGGCRLETDGAEPVPLRAGDVALVPHGDGHRLRSAPGTIAPSVMDLPQAFANDRYSVLHHGSGGEPTTLVCAAVQVDTPGARDLVELLPPLLHVGASPRTEWMQATLRLVAAEAEELRPGGEAVLTRLADVLVIQVVRSWLETDAAARTGWLGALADPRIGRAITLIHREPARAWTVASLAAEVPMSRSAFAARFTALVGEPVLGYRSEAAFSRAFTRVIGMTPGAVRRGATSVGTGGVLTPR